jgi:hypothetical protein
MFTEGAYGTKGWKGNLRYMKPGEGYMIYRKQDTQVTFYYPYYELGSSFFDGNSMQVRSMTSDLTDYAQTMSLVAVVDGIELQEGDRLLALCDGEMLGEAVADSAGIHYVSIAGDKHQKISFAIERDGDIVATTGDVLTYRPNAISGTPDEPTVIHFVQADSLPQEGWYTLQGIKLQQEPVRSGVYIHNGKKVKK